jgi:uncharacterized membrane protein
MGGNLGRLTKLGALAGSFIVLASVPTFAVQLALGADSESTEVRTTIDAALEMIATGIELAGVGIIVVGAVAATLLFLSNAFGTAGWNAAFNSYRANLGRGILLGLEFLVAADIIGTVAVTPSIENLLVLGLIVLIRTFLSISLEVEIDGQWPWKRAGAKSDSA